MKKSLFQFILLSLLAAFLTACGSDLAPKKETMEEEALQVVDSSSIKKTNDFESILRKYKTISFDTLKVEYADDENDKRFLGKELTLKEARTLPIGLTENYFGKLSGVYACYQFQIDSSRLGLITRIPSEYESTSIVLLVFDLQKNKFQNEYFYLGSVNGDAGEISVRISWLFRAKNKQLQSFVYDYQSFHEIDDTLTTESRDYFLVDCMKPTFDTLSGNQTQLKKRFRNLLKTED